jgi:hypothetical protein
MNQKSIYGRWSGVSHVHMPHRHTASSGQLCSISGDLDPSPGSSYQTLFPLTMLWLLMVARQPDAPTNMRCSHHASIFDVEDLSRCCNFTRWRFHRLRLLHTARTPSRPLALSLKELPAKQRTPATQTPADHDEFRSAAEAGRTQ